MSRLGDDVDADGGFVAVSVDVGSAGLVFGVRAFDHPGFDTDAAVGEQVGQNGAADGADQVDDGVGDDAGGLDCPRPRSPSGRQCPAALRHTYPKPRQRPFLITPD